MKSTFIGILKYHLIPILGCIFALLLLDLFLFKTIPTDSQKTIHIKGTASSVRGVYSNCEQQQAEIELIASLRSKEKLTIMGSSELQGLAYSSFYFLPDSMGMPVTAFGHAYHQNLSIACELLAAGNQLQGANICILLSPGWFETHGTNIEAFLEFVRPNFLRSIIHDTFIPKEDKIRIAEYIYHQYHNINNPSLELAYFKNLYITEKKLGFPKSIEKIHASRIEQVKYDITPRFNDKQLHTNTAFDNAKTKKRLEEAFLKTCTNNSIYVDSFYYSKYLMSTGTYKKAKMNPVPLGAEFDDFLFVLDILKRNNCKASFVLQPLNPHNFDDLQQMNTVRSEIQKKLKEYGFPFLDMFVTTTQAYTPGVLKDIMHPGDRGWADINEFLVKHYKKQ